MVKILFFACILVISTVNCAEEEKPLPKKKCYRSETYATREATVLSMMGWGIALFAGIAALCALVNDNPSDTTTTTTTK